MDGVFFAMWVMVAAFFLSSMQSVGVSLVQASAVTPTLTDATVRFSFGSSAL